MNITQPKFHRDISHRIATDLRSIGINQPNQLINLEPLDIYSDLANVMGHRHDPCLLDVLISAKRFLEGEHAKPWWNYTSERRALLENYTKTYSK